MVDFFRVGMLCLLSILVSLVKLPLVVFWSIIIWAICIVFYGFQQRKKSSILGIFSKFGKSEKDFQVIRNDLIFLVLICLATYLAWMLFEVTPFVQQEDTVN